MTRLFLLAAVCVALAAATVSAQSAAPTAAPPPPDAPAAAAPPTPPAGFVYAVDGRRDPFVPLLGSSPKSGAAESARPRADGALGITTDELSVRGVLESQGRWVAMIAGPSGKVFTVRAGDRLADGTIRTITAQYLLIVQQVNDPLSLDKQREVRKFLRGGETK